MQHLFPTMPTTAYVMVRALRHVAVHLVFFALFAAATVFLATHVLPPAADTLSTVSPLPMLVAMLGGFAALGAVSLMTIAAWLSWRSRHAASSSDNARDADAELQRLTLAWRHTVRRQWIHTSLPRWITLLLAVLGLMFPSPDYDVGVAAAWLSLGGLFLWFATLSRFVHALRREVDGSQPLATAH